MNPRPIIPALPPAPSAEAVYDAAAQSTLDNRALPVGEDIRAVPLAAPVDENGGSGCHGGKAEMQRAAGASANSEVLARLQADYPQGPHDQPQSMCPAFGSLARRPAHAPHRHRPVRLGLLRLRPDLHLALLRRQAHGRLRAVQFRNARHRQALRGHPRRGPQARRSRRSTTRSSSPISACPSASGVPLRALPKEINGVRIIGIDVPGFGVPTHAEAKDVLAGAMLNYARLEAANGPVQAPRRRQVRQADRHASGRDVPGRPGHHRPHAGADGPCRRSRSCRRANGASSMPRSTAPRSPPSIPSTPPRSASSTPPAAPSSARRRSASTAPPPGSTPSARPAACRRARSTPPRTRSSRRQRLHSPDRRSRPASRCPATRDPNSSSAVSWSNPAPTCAMSAPPARRRSGTRPTPNGCRPRVSMSNSAPRWKRISRRSTPSSRTSPSAPRRSSSTPSRRARPASTSPT